MLIVVFGCQVDLEKSDKEYDLYTDPEQVCVKWVLWREGAS